MSLLWVSSAFCAGCEQLKKHKKHKTGTAARTTTTRTKTAATTKTTSPENNNSSDNDNKIRNRGDIYFPLSFLSRESLHVYWFIRQSREKKPPSANSPVINNIYFGGLKTKQNHEYNGVPKTLRYLSLSDRKKQ